MSNIQVTNIKNLSGNNTVAISSASGDLIVKNDLIAESAVEISGTITANSSGLEVLGISTLTELVVNDIISIGQSVSIASGIITATSFVGDGSGITGIITNVEAGSNITIVENPAGNFIVTSTLPQLSEDLNLGVNDIIGTGNIDIVGLVSATSFTGNGSNLSGVVTSLLLTGENGITVSSVGTAYTISSNFTSVADDSTPQLGGELDLNNNNITGIGTINIDGDITGNKITGNLDAPQSLSVGNDVIITGLTGRISATSFVGDGSALTGVIGSGSGVVIKENDASVGTAGTINFASGLEVSDISAGIVTVTSGIEIENSGSSVGTAINAINFSTNLTATASGGIATITAPASSGSGLGSRQIFSGSTSSSHANDTPEDLTISTYKGYALYKVSVSEPSWVTLYVSSTTRTSDANRSITEDPSPGSGIIAEAITESSSETVLFTPAVIGFNDDSTPSTNVYLKVVNKSGSTQSINIDLTVTQLEV